MNESDEDDILDEIKINYRIKKESVSKIIPRWLFERNLN
jgi:hypothetical protein